MDNKVDKKVIPPMPPPAPKKIEDPRVRVMTFGKTWAEMLRVDPGSAQYLLMSLGTSGYCISPQDFEAIREQESNDFYQQNLQGKSSAAATWVFRLQYYVRKAQIVLVDTDTLDTAIGQEILRNAAGWRIPAYAVGVTANTSTIAPYYVRGIVFPATVEDLHNLIRQVTAPKPQKVEAPKPEEPAPKLEKAEKPDLKMAPPPPPAAAPDVVETL